MIVANKLELQVAERLWVPCPLITSANSKHKLTGNAEDLEGWCSRCYDRELKVATGKVYPLRVPCSGADLNNINSLGGLTLIHVECRVIKYSNFPVEYLSRCDGGCQGRGYIANTDYDVLKTAVRAKGWYISIFGLRQGDSVAITGEGPKDTLGEVFAHSGLRDTEAILTALIRALS